MPSIIRQTLCETRSFSRQAAALWSEAEQEALKDYLAQHPLSGDEIPATGGVRKLRWGRKGIGKRGGARVIYYVYDQTAPIYLLYAYAKSSQEDMTEEERKAIATMAQSLKEEIRNRKRKR